MEQHLPLDLETYFAAVDDPRVERTKRHKLLDIIIIAICGMICGAEGWVEIEEFGKEKEAWLKTILELPNGIPSHDTFGRVFACLDPVKFNEYLLKVLGLQKEVAIALGHERIEVDKHSLLD